MNNKTFFHTFIVLYYCIRMVWKTPVISLLSIFVWQWHTVANWISKITTPRNIHKIQERLFNINYATKIIPPPRHEYSYSGFLSLARMTVCCPPLEAARTSRPSNCLDLRVESEIRTTCRITVELETNLRGVGSFTISEKAH